MLGFGRQSNETDRQQCIQDLLAHVALAELDYHQEQKVEEYARVGRERDYTTETVEGGVQTADAHDLLATFCSSGNWRGKTDL
jgi:hypothetical protein